MYSDIEKIASRIKYLREVFGLSASELAGALNISESQYLDAENGKFDFTFTFLQKIAKHYSVDIVELISGDTPKLSGFQVVRKGEGAPLDRRKGFKYLNLAYLFKDKNAQPFMVTAKYKKEEQQAPIPLSSHNDQEFNLVIKGKIKFQFQDYTTILEEGDSVYYDASLPHGMIASGADCEFLAVVIKKEGEAKLPQPIKPSLVQKSSDDALYKQFLTESFDENGRISGIDFHPREDFNFAYHVVDALAEKSPNKKAMVWVSEKGENKNFTFSDMKTYSDKCANFFLSLGIKKGDKVMLVLKRNYQYWYALLALHKIGAIAIPATHLLTQKDFEYRFNAAGVSAVVITNDDKVILECEMSLPASPTLKTKIVAGGEKEGWINLDNNVDKASSKLEPIKNHIDDTMIMYFTSGTTGYPKIVDHTYRYPLGHFITAKHWHNVDTNGIHWTISDTGWAKAAWGKIYGQWICESAIFTYDYEKFDAHQILTNIEKYNITTLCAPPTIYRFLVKDDLSGYNLTSLKHATVAGEALNPEVFEQFYKETGLELMEGFGQTETTLAIANFVGDKVKCGSMGKPSPQFAIELVDADNKKVATGEVGEIVIRTDKEIPTGLFKGYYQNKEGTLAVWNNDVYHTGDMAWQDEDGYIWYVSRVDDVIKSSGYRIGPFEVESVIMEIPYVLECAVTGVPDEQRGQLVKASIVLTKGVNANDQLKKEIQNYVKENTAPYKYPRIVEFMDELPKTISGKIMRKDLR